MLFGGMLEASTRYSVPGSSLDISFHGDFIVTILAEIVGQGAELNDHEAIAFLCAGP
jgi:hypothetical protein